MDNLGAATRLSFAPGFELRADLSLIKFAWISEARMDSQERPGRLLQLVGIAALSLASFSCAVNFCASEYSATRGTVTSSWVTDLSGVPIENSQCSESQLYNCVCYRYEVGGEVYNRQAHSEILATDDSTNVVRAYVPGKNLIVYYTPADPYQSGIWSEIPQNELILVFLGIGSYLLAFLCRKFEAVAHFFGAAMELNERELATPEPHEASFT